MHKSRDKEDLQISYISALCAASGISYDTQSHDDDSTDGIIKKRINLGDGRFYDAAVRIQLKCTSSASQYEDKGTYITYKLKVKNYNDLCTPSTTPIILGLLILPENEDEWIDWSTEELLIRGCMYWKDFSGCEKSNNAGTVNVKIEKSDVINQKTLNDILTQIAKEGWI